jgi:exosome complex RNA-binding protein Rrp42 (RNase PH superfamily)
MYLYEFLQQHSRPDGRCFHQARTTRLVKGILGKNTVTPTPSTTDDANATISSSLKHSNVAGSAMIHLGNTIVLSAVTLQVGQPMAGWHPEWGDVMVQMEWANNNTTNTNNNNTASFATKTALWIQRCLLSSQMLEVSQLCLLPGYAAWRLHLTLLVLQDDGNLADASLLAAVAALMDTRLPATQLQDKTVSNSGSNSGSSSSSTPPQPQQRAVVTIVSDQPSHPLLINLENIPVSLTMVMYHHHHHHPEPLLVAQDGATSSTTNHHDDTTTTTTHWLVDPTTLEESWIADRLTMVVTTGAATEMLTSSPNHPPEDILHVSHVGVMDTSVLATAYHLTKGRAQEIQDLLLL